MFTEKRRRVIVEVLHKNEDVYVNDLVSLFNVSKETIINDLNFLAQKNGQVNAVTAVP